MSLLREKKNFDVVQNMVKCKNGVLHSKPALELAPGDLLARRSVEKTKDAKARSLFRANWRFLRSRASETLLLF